MTNYQHFVSRLEQAVQQQKGAISQSEHQANQAQNQWLSARAKTKSMDLVKGKHAEQERKIEDKQEQKYVPSKTKQNLSPAVRKIVKENKIDKTGFHIQSGLKFQLFMLDAFLFYRQTFGEFEDVLDAKTYGSMNLRLGLGF